MPHIVRLQKRDILFLCGLFESRVMTAGHVSTLYFDCKREYTKKRLQKLKAAGFIGERKRNANEPSVLFLTRKGFVHLKNEGQLSQYPPLGANSFEARANVSQFTLRHELEIMDAKAAFHAALAQSRTCSIAEFITWPLLYQFEVLLNGYGSEVLVKPDGFIRIHEKETDGGLSEHTLFLEVDRSSETQDTLVNRTGAYLAYYKSGGFAVRNGATRDRFKEYPFRVLMVFKSEERRNNMAARLVENNPPILTLTWLTTLAEATAHPLGAIWIQPKDYRDAVKGTPFENSPSGNHRAYMRQTTRDSLVAQKMQKRRLLEDDTAATSQQNQYR
jgi:hypothetical protein